MKALLGFSLVLVLTGSALGAAGSLRPEVTGQTKLQSVRQIYVGEMGRSDEARRFRLLLQDQLAKKGFVVVEKIEDADAILTGALSVRVDEGSQARAYIRLDAQNGERLWARDFGEHLFKGLFTFKEPVKLRAEEVARALRSQVNK